MWKVRLVVMVSVVVAWSTVAGAQALGVVNVNAPAVNCVFDTSCTIGVTDSVATFTLPGTSGLARLQSRMFTGSTGAPAAGAHGYEYRVDLTDVLGITALPCVSSLRVAFGPVSAFQYNGAGPLDQVYVVTSGGLGTIGLASAVKSGDDITFTLASPVCAGSSPGTGATSYFFGLASTRAPTAITAVVTQSFGTLGVDARAPSLDKCASGGALASSDACVTDVCAVDSYCCTTAWDALCVSEVRTVCDNLSCAEANGTCSHSLCDAGSSLVNTCDSAKANCVSAICAVDSFCCATSWDALCVDEVDTVCGAQCD